jgi:hypothetical protein
MAPTRGDIDAVKHILWRIALPQTVVAPAEDGAI